MIRIAKVDLTGQGSNLTLEMTVIAPTLGWKVELSPYVYIVRPEDGVQEFKLLGTPPTGMAGMALESHEIKIAVPNSPWFQGVGINSDEQSMLKLMRPSHGQTSIGEDIVFMDQPGIRNQDKLVIPVRYGGGCKKHKFQLNWNGIISESMPPQITMDLTHNNNGDACQAMISEDLQFDLSVLEGLPEGKIVIHIKSTGTEYSVIYN